MSKRIATMSIFVENRESIASINKILMDFSEEIISRMGIPYREAGISVIVLILETDNDKIGALSGKIGNLKGVSVKTAAKK
ncbi:MULTISPECIES: TM1266 family iron-only hydrogenase system putative regulator [Psychrilyobacter]|uniref:CopG family transcriptional regulator n=1 Tax=Psychrilyobacter piezotolerans TaxID=2293438 RepID=A0ABX9KDY4_9FUSO|nr:MULTISPECIES: TM1266 family iron-only hydrogenase system putative regulator [Psychrilyobacter]MCS5421944.1 iron-only hydrogenase system regulator [Psychrilyobacter sp. S5]NDI78962.1 CopG family transcriptional regulator [Psychrilyobacter piezotolerans]RDE59254.1 CopG family transcriptional regulator [Psychrilyobacter sp. S5]REI39814.1 CopG family transcriptional regulator [Psychrilyobacter piezotolerans]